VAVSDRGPRLHEIELPKVGKVRVYAGVRVGRALDEVTEEMTLYQGVRLSQVLEAVYEQGRRDGRREVFDALGEVQGRKELAHRTPGRPRKAKNPK
jgi:hypothetical protein